MLPNIRGNALPIAPMQRVLDPPMAANAAHHSLRDVLSVKGERGDEIARLFTGFPGRFSVFAVCSLDPVVRKSNLWFSISCYFITKWAHAKWRALIFLEFPRPFDDVFYLSEGFSKEDLGIEELSGIFFHTLTFRRPYERGFRTDTQVLHAEEVSLLFRKVPTLNEKFVVVVDENSFTPFSD